MNDKSLYILPPIPNKSFPIYIEIQKYFNKDEIFKTHWHEHFEILFITNGELKVICNTKTFIASKGDLIIINPNDIHHLYSVSNSVEYFCLVFDITMLNSLNTDSIDKEYLIPLINNQLLFDNYYMNIENIKSCLINLHYEYKSDYETKNLAIKSYMFQLLTLLFRTCNYSILTPTIFNRRNCNLSLIQKILIYLNKNYDKEIDLKILSIKFNISYYHLCHIFKDYTNMSIIQYVTTIRIEKSLHYIKNTDKSLSEIATQIGYNDSNYFSRKFKQIMSMSPREYINSL